MVNTYLLVAVICLYILLAVIIIIKYRNKKQKSLLIRNNRLTVTQNKNSSVDYKCVVYIDLTSDILPDIISFQEQYGLIITHLHINVNFSNMPIVTDISDSKIFAQQILSPFYTMINQYNTQQLLTIQKQGTKLILWGLPNHGYYGYGTIPYSTTAPQPTSNPMDNDPPSCGGVPVVSVVTQEMVDTLFTKNKNTTPIVFDGFDVDDEYYGIIENGIIEVYGTYCIYNLAQFMYFIKTQGTIANKNFTLSMALAGTSVSLLNYIPVCDINNKSINIILSIIDYGCDMSYTGDPNMYTQYQNVLSRNKYLIGVDLDFNTDISNTITGIVDGNFAGLMIYELNSSNFSSGVLEEWATTTGKIVLCCDCNNYTTVPKASSDCQSSCIVKEPQDCSYASCHRNVC